MSGFALRVSAARTRSLAVLGCAALCLLAVAVPVAGAGGVEWNVARIGGPVDTPDDVIIAVVDTGVDADHPAFGDRVMPQLDLTGDDEDGDPQGHGTHVAGTAAGGRVDCGRGPSSIGVAPGARILPIRVLDAEGSGTVGDVVAGIRTAADRGATVINLSLGGDLSFLDGGGDAFRRAIDHAWSKGSIPVLAAGNSGLLGSIFGSGYGDIQAVVVTATTNADRKASYASSVGSAKWGIAAPGGDESGQLGRGVLSAYPGSMCAVLGGTSMAAPHVSGALAALRSRGLSPREAVDRLLSTAAPIGARSTYGAGLVDLAAAIDGLDAAGVDGPATASSLPETITTTTSPPPADAPAEPTALAPTSSSTTAPETTSSTVPVDSPALPLEVSPSEIAGSLGSEDGETEAARPALIALAAAGCLASGVAALRLHRRGRQP